VQTGEIDAGATICQILVYTPKAVFAILVGSCAGSHVKEQTDRDIARRPMAI
jgi:hypothetical protein